MPRLRQIAPGGTGGTAFREVARVRRTDADVLLANQRYRGAIYLAGYAIECLLKWAVTQRRDVVYLPAELETHDWDTLLPETGLAVRLQAEAAMVGVYTELAESWGPELRYLTKDPKPGEARGLYHKLIELYDWIDENAL